MEKLKPYDLMRVLKKPKGVANKGEKAKTKARNRAKNRMARKSRRLNIRKGKISGRQ